MTSVFFRRPNLLQEVRVRMRLRPAAGAWGRVGTGLGDGAAQAERIATSAGDALIRP